MDTDDILCGSLLEGQWLSIERLAALCEVEPQWLIGRIEAGLLQRLDGLSLDAGEPCFDAAALLRALRMHRIERDFDAVPELAALVADLLEEIDQLRQRLRRAGLE